MIVNILAFVIIFGLLVFAHELGHYTAAKLCGVYVYEFSLGIGPRIFRKKYKGTVYSIRIIPFGGYVKLAGMEGAEAEDKEETLDPEDERNFNKQPIWKRIVTIASGPIMSFILGIVLFAAYFGINGIPPVTVIQVWDDSPAAEAGIMPEDRVLSIDGEKVLNSVEFSRILNSKGGRQVDLLVSRSGEEIEFKVEPVWSDKYGRWIMGVNLERFGSLVGPEGQIRGQRFGLVKTISGSVGYGANLMRMLVLFLRAMVRGEVEAEVSGPIGIYHMTGVMAKQGLLLLLPFAALLSLNLALFNILPIPVLDGGWILLFLVEAIRRKPLKPEHENAVRLIGFAFLMLLFFFAMFKDINRLVGS